HSIDDLDTKGRRFLLTYRKLLCGGFVPYYVVRQLAHYHRASQEKDMPPADFGLVPGLGSLMPRVVAALDLGGFAPIRSGQGVAWEFEHPGLAFAHLLESWRGGSDSFEEELEATSEAVRAKIGLSWPDSLARYVKQLERAPWAMFPPQFAPEA